MKAWELQNFGLENLKLVERPVPVPGPKQLLVKVSAVSLNYRDKAIADGIYLPHLMHMPMIPVSDTAGVVVDKGNEVTAFNIGDRVISHLYPTWIDAPTHPADVSEHALGGPLDGGLADYLLLEDTGAVTTPPNLTDEEACTLPIAALTIWTALLENGDLKPGQVVVTQGTGGVSLFATQFASAMGAKVIAMSGEDRKLSLLQKLGAAELINYKKDQDWPQSVLQLTGGRGADHIIDVIGGRSLNRSVQAIADGGQVSVVGFLDGISSTIDLLPVVFKAVKLRGILVGNLRSFEHLTSFIDEKQIKPVIDTVYPFSEALAAFAHLERGPVGKIVISLK